MKSEFIDALLKEINTGFESMSGRINEVLEVSKVRSQLDELAKDRNSKLAELGTLTFRKVTEKEIISEEDINKIIEDIKTINERIALKKEELDKKIAETTAKAQSCCPDTEPSEQSKTCPTCNAKLDLNDKFCKNCGSSLS